MRAGCADTGRIPVSTSPNSQKQGQYTRSWNVIKRIILSSGYSNSLRPILRGTKILGASVRTRRRDGIQETQVQRRTGVPRVPPVASYRQSWLESIVASLLILVARGVPWGVAVVGVPSFLSASNRENAPTVWHAGRDVLLQTHILRI